MSQAPMSDITQDDKLWAALSYIPIISWPILAIVMLVWQEKSNRPYIKFNALQAIVVGVVAYITSALCIGLLLALYMFYLAYQAYQGQDVKVPVVTDFIRNQGWA